MSASPTLEDIREAYARIGTFKGVGRALGISDHTVKRHLERADLLDPAVSKDVGGDPTGDFVEIPVLPVDLSHMESVSCYPMGDFHVGASAHDYGLLQEWIDYVASRDDVSVILTGDLLNCALKDSKSEAYDEKLTVGEAKRVLTKMLEPIASKIAVAIPGNHEARVFRSTGSCPVEDIAHFLEIPYYRDSVLLAYKVGGVEYDIYLRHGNGGGGIGARANRLQKGSQVVWADIYITGHVHNQAAFIEDLFRREGDRMLRHRKLYVASGSFLRYEGYAAVAGYSPGKLGAPRIRLDGSRKDAHVSI